MNYFNIVVIDYFHVNVSCRIVGLKMSAFSTFALKSLNEIKYDTKRSIWMPSVISCEICMLSYDV